MQGVCAHLGFDVEHDSHLVQRRRYSLARGLCRPRIEPEGVFGLEATPHAGANRGDLFAALDRVAHGFEVVQSHLPDLKFTAA